MTYPIDADEFSRLMNLVSMPLTREAERSLWLNRVVAVRIAEDPDRAIAIAQENLDRMEAVQPGMNPWLRAWRSVLDAGVDVVLGVLTSREPEAAELRQNSPFAGVLGYRERERVLESFRRHWSRAHSRAQTAAL
jgi:hypothetical protein